MSQGFAAFGENQDGFAQFPPTQVVDPVATSDKDDHESPSDENFGDFNQMDETTDAQDDGFGDFGTGDDGFGDFESKKDGFGDFEAPPTVASVVSYQDPEGDESEERRLKSLVDVTEFSEKVRNIAVDVTKSFPITHPPIAHPAAKPLLFKEGKSYKLNGTSEACAQLWNKFQTHNVYTNPESFRWRTSAIRTSFVSALKKKPVIKEEVLATSNSDPSLLDTSKPPLKSEQESAEMELLKAKKLLEVSEGLIY
jgi:hypothetical protein